MNIFSVIAFSLVGMLFSVTIKKVRPEIAVLISLATGVMILIEVCTSFFDVFRELESIAEKNGINTAYFKIALKSCIIAYITQFASELCKDAGEGAIGVKVELAGKLSIVIMALPVISGFINAISELLGRI